MFKLRSSSIQTIILVSQDQRLEFYPRLITLKQKLKFDSSKFTDPYTQLNVEKDNLEFIELNHLVRHKIETLPKLSKTSILEENEKDKKTTWDYGKVLLC